MTDSQADKIIALLERIAVALERPPEGFVPGSVASNDWHARLFDVTGSGNRATPVEYGLAGTPKP